MVKRLQQVGNSHGIVLDRAIREAIGLSPNDAVQILVSGGSLIITPARVGVGQEEIASHLKALRPRYGKMLRTPGEVAVGTSRRFLSVEDVTQIHLDTLRHEGGLSGTRDHGLPESAVMMPRQQFDGSYLHRTLAEQAAAYLFHICANHPFNVTETRERQCSHYSSSLRVNGVTHLPDSVRVGGTDDEVRSWLFSYQGSSHYFFPRELTRRRPAAASRSGR